MTTATGYLDDVVDISNDVAAFAGVTGTLGTILDVTDELLGIPKKLEEQLRRGEVLDLPDVIVFPLSFIPTIGTAIKTLDGFLEPTAEKFEEQADIMEALDNSLSVPQDLVSGMSTVNTVFSNTFQALQAEHDIRLNEANLLVDSLGNQVIYEQSELSARIGDYSSIAEVWIDTRDAVMAPLNAAVAQLQSVGDSLEDALSAFTSIEDIMDSVFGVIEPVTDVIEDLEDAICVVFEITPEIVVPDVVVTPAIWVPPVVVLGVTITPGFWIPAVIIPGFTVPAVTVDICGIIEDLSNQLQIVQDFVVGVINDVLSLLGFDLLDAIDDIIDTLLSPLEPVFAAIAVLQSAAGDIMDALADALAEVEQAFNDVIEAVEDLVSQSSLFNNNIEGTDFANALAGSAEEDAIFGKAGNDDLDGEGGNDFLFGGADDDDLNGGGGNDEAFGGDGDDKASGGFGNDLVDGGAGKDVLLGQGGNDTLIGGEDRDILLGGGGEDNIIFNFGDGTDIVIGFEDNLDTLIIDSDLVGGATTGQQVVNGFATSLGSLTILDFGADKIVLLGVDDDVLGNDILVV